ncbi:MAG: hypothetical protein LBC44_01575 [Mycoplasmataceae bacterium]|jgi:hypothetical protein|nr:hypothetical protein [Mycoplasmataceae bacterium]
MVKTKSWVEIVWKNLLTEKQIKLVNGFMKKCHIVLQDGKYVIDYYDPVWIYLYDFAHCVLETKEIWENVAFIEIYQNTEPEYLLEQWKDLKLI